MDSGGAGFRAQTAGLGNAIAARHPQTAITTITVSSRLWPRLFLSASLPDKDRPDVVIACGRAAVVPALAAKRRHGAFTVYIQRPPKANAFDAVVCGLHDNLTGDNVLPIIGSVGGFCANTLVHRRHAAEKIFAAVPEPRTAVLIGGSNRAFNFTPEDCRQLAAEIKETAGDSGLLVSVSRRTGKQNTAIFDTAFAGSKHFFFNGNGDNPYTDMLAVADRFVVTGDSVNMLSEACTAGKPTYIFPLRKKFICVTAAKFHRFHHLLIDNGYARLWEKRFDEWSSPAFNETARAADFVLRRYHEWCQRG
jgi:hypothetical protein